MVVGIMAHVDAGKTTLSEAILYTSGAIKKAGRVDKRDAFLDTHDLEKDRGITIFSKEARFSYKDKDYVLIDTPGHTDFIAETERILDVLDACILVVSGVEKIKSHVLYLFKKLMANKIPTVIFINKTDIPGADKSAVFMDLKKYTGFNVIDFSELYTDTFYEEIATTDENILESYMEKGTIDISDIKKLIADCKIVPLFSGSALKLTGVNALLDGINLFFDDKKYSEEKSFKAYKITHDESGKRLTHVKITGGKYKTREELNGEKITEIRKYSGKKYESVQSVSAGDICAFLGVSVVPEKKNIKTAVMNYTIKLPDDVNVAEFVQKISVLKEEDPELHIIYREEEKDIQVRLFGQVQKEVLTSIIKKRFGVDVEFSKGKVCYRETIEQEVYGAGHFEPLRHYAEVHLKLTPLEEGEGLKFKIDATKTTLPKNFQNLIISNLKETEIPGVLTGSPITDMCITVVDGKSHIKHTEGGDFRQAARRAIRQGLMKADSVLLEPWYEINMNVSKSVTGKIMNDVTMASGEVQILSTEGECNNLHTLMPVSFYESYQEELRRITKGEGDFDINFYGYKKCHNEAEVIENSAYNPLSDLDFSPDSVFCSHGAAVIVPWDEADSHMHVGKELMINEDYLKDDFSDYNLKKISQKVEIEKADESELKEIFDKTYGLKKRDVKYKYSRNYDKKSKNGNTYEDKEQYEKIRKKKGISKDKVMLVDGYNVIYAWDDLKELAKENISAAREKLMDILSNYAAFIGTNLILVFDAYMVKGNTLEYINYHNIQVVYTKEAQTADQYIAESSLKLSNTADITVATSDGMVQLIILGHNCKLMSSRELKEDVDRKTDINL